MIRRNRETDRKTKVLKRIRMFAAFAASASSIMLISFREGAAVSWAAQPDGISQQTASKQATNAAQSIRTQNETGFYAQYAAKFLPEEISECIPDSAVLVSKEIAVTEENDIKNVKDCSAVTDERLVGTYDRPADPLAKTNGENFVPISAGTARQKMQKLDKTKEQGEKQAANERNEGNLHPNILRPASLMTSDEASSAGSENAKELNIGKIKKENSPAAENLENVKKEPHWEEKDGEKIFYDGEGKPFSVPSKFIIDVSEWKGDIDWEAVKKTGVDGAIIRLGIGSLREDKKFERNVEECMKLKIPFGLWHSSYAENEEEARKEAEFIEKSMSRVGISNRDLRLPAYLCVMSWSWPGHKFPSNSMDFEKIIRTWWDSMLETGIDRIGVTSNLHNLQNELKAPYIHDRTTWVAQYDPILEYKDFRIKLRGWQYSPHGIIPGVSQGETSLNAFNSIPYEPLDIWNKRLATGDLGKRQELYINSKLSEKMSADIIGGSVYEDSYAQLSGGNKAESQKFEFLHQGGDTYKIKNVKSGLLLSAEYDETMLPKRVMQSEDGEKWSQKWVIRHADDGSCFIQSVMGDWVLTVQGGQPDEQASLYIDFPVKNDAQKFILTSTAQIQENVPVSIVSAINPKAALDVKYGSTESGTDVWIYGRNDTPAQRFIFERVGNGIYEIRNVRSRMVLTPENDKNQIGTGIKQYLSEGRQPQRWAAKSKPGGSFVFSNAESGKVLDICGGSIRDGTRLQIWDENGTKAQMFNIESSGNVEEGVYEITPKKAGGIRLGAGQKSGKGEQLSLVSSSSDPNLFKWHIVKDASGFLTLRNEKSSLVADVESGIATNGAKVQMWDCNFTPAQKWRTVRNSDGTYTFLSASDINYALDIKHGIKRIGEKIRLYEANGTSAQKWVMRKARV